MRRGARLPLVISAAIAAWQPAAAGCAAGEAPEVARRQGYVQNTFHNGFTASSIDTDNGLTAGTNWYLAQFFGGIPSRPDRLAVSSDGALTLLGTSVQIGTAAPLRRGKEWRGQAFGGGGYFSAVLKVDRAGQPGVSQGWPAFWSMAIEHLAESGESQWSGQPDGYEHFIEPDFFEDDIAPDAAGHVRYGGAMHEWYGKFKGTCAPQIFCAATNIYAGHTRYENVEITLPDGATLGEFHEYGFLWVPATDDRDGFAQYYFDGHPTPDRVSWSKFRDQAPPPGLAPWTFGIIDRQHLVLFLTTGSERPMTVQCVNVWQSSAARNLVR
jgi:hypothetical protein